MSEQATGTPRAIASSTGRPKPSPSEGSTKQSARRVETLELGVVEPAGEAHAVGDAELRGALASVCS